VFMALTIYEALPATSHFFAHSSIFTSLPETAFTSSRADGRLVESFKKRAEIFERAPVTPWRALELYQYAHEH